MAGNPTEPPPPPNATHTNKNSKLLSKYILFWTFVSLIWLKWEQIDVMQAAGKTKKQTYTSDPHTTPPPPWRDAAGLTWCSVEAAAAQFKANSATLAMFTQKHTDAARSFSQVLAQKKRKGNTELWIEKHEISNLFPGDTGEKLDFVVVSLTFWTQMFLVNLSQTEA